MTPLDSCDFSRDGYEPKSKCFFGANLKLESSSSTAMGLPRLKGYDFSMRSSSVDVSSYGAMLS